jgi:flagellar biosynthesis regulator FlaF
MSFTNYVIESGENYKKNLPLNRTLLHFNNLKFDGGFISKLIDLVKQVYNKKVEFNIVNLKKMHLNSDIYTQAVSLKLKNRDNKLYRVLKASLRKIKLPVIKKIDEIQKKPNRDEFLVNIIRNNTISTMLKKIKKNKIRNDNLNKLLLKFYPLADNLKLNVIKKPFSIIRSFSLEDYVLRSLKHLNLRGIRVEAKGRLTRRFTASRSVSKMRCKGGLKNVDSSFRGLSTIMLRGIVKSNLQYSTINSKNRNGAFGIKA